MSDDSWAKEISELPRRQAAAREMRGADKVRIQQEKGKLTVRDRIEALLDTGSFRELGIAGVGTYAPDGKFSPSNTIIGGGCIEGRPIVVSADDFTIRGGSADAAIHKKQIQAEQMANELRLPIVRLIDGTIEGGIEAAYKAQLESAEDPIALRKEIEDRLNAVRPPFRAAEKFLVEEIIAPRETRPPRRRLSFRATSCQARRTARGFVCGTVSTSFFRCGPF